MYRVLTPLVAGLLILGATVMVFVRVDEALHTQNTARVTGDVVRAQQQLLQASRLEGFDLANQAATFAREDEFVQIFSKPDVADRQQAAYVAVEVRKARLEKKGDLDDKEPPKVGIIGVVDEQGMLLARDIKPTWRRGDDLKKDFPSLAGALQGQANKDVWNLDGGMYRVGSAPIRGAQGNVVGAVFVGYVQSTQDATAARQVLGTDVAFFLDNKIHASSFQRSGESTRSETAEEKALAGELFEGQKLAEQALNAHQATPVFRVKIGREEWMVAAAPLPGNATPSKSGFLVLESLSAVQSTVAPLTVWILGLGLISLLAMIGTAVFTARRFLNPLDRIEAGVSEVINGNHDYVFEKSSPDFEGLANLLNGMLARLLGRPDPSDEDEDVTSSTSLSSVNDDASR